MIKCSSTTATSTGEPASKNIRKAHNNIAEGNHQIQARLADLLREKNTTEWLTDLADKLCILSKS
jgi:hypothetical protein